MPDSLPDARRRSTRIPFRARGALLALATAVCSTATGLVVQDPEPDAATEISTVAFRYDQARRAGGMAGLVQSVQQCYQDATVPFTKVWALRECIVLDHAAYLTGVSVGRRVFHDPNPYFADQTHQSRSWTYGKMDGFSLQRQLVNYLLDAEALLNTRSLKA